MERPVKRFVTVISLSSSRDYHPRRLPLEIPASSNSTVYALLLESWISARIESIAGEFVLIDAMSADVSRVRTIL